jgi:uncharacterized membrane protein
VTTPDSAGAGAADRDATPPAVGTVSVDIYKFLIEQADRISARRATANSYFLTLHTGLVAFVGVLSSARRASTSNPPKVDDFTFVVLGFAGCVLAASWWLLLRSYRDLNAAKFKVITDIEKALPLQPFAREWEYLKRDEPLPWWKGRYAELGFVERVVPIVFLVVYVVLVVRVLSA